MNTKRQLFLTTTARLGQWHRKSAVSYCGLRAVTWAIEAGVARTLPAEVGSNRTVLTLTPEGQRESGFRQRSREQAGRAWAESLLLGEWLAESPVCTLLTAAEATALMGRQLHDRKFSKDGETLVGLFPLRDDTSAFAAVRALRKWHGQLCLHDVFTGLLQIRAEVILSSPALRHKGSEIVRLLASSTRPKMRQAAVDLNCRVTVLGETKCSRNTH